jgi:hypothetical protein
MTPLPQHVGPTLSYDVYSALEDYLWHNLTHLWGYVPLQRRSPIPKPFQDILALDGDRLVVIILKEAEDVWVGYQAETYAQYLLQKRPFSKQINYDYPIQIRVISPGYSSVPEVQDSPGSVSVEIKFWTVSCLTQHPWVLVLRDCDSQVIQTIQIQDPLLLAGGKVALERKLPPKTTKLQQLLVKAHPAAQEGIEKIWEHLLKTDAAMMEFTYGDGVRVGLGKACPCFEVMADDERQDIALFLWLPLKLQYGTRQPSVVVRMRIWTDWRRVTDIGYIPEGLGRKLTFAEFRMGIIKPMRRALVKRSYNRYFSDPNWRKIVADEQESRYNRHPWADAKYEYALTVTQYEKLIQTEVPEHSLLTLVEWSLESCLKF